MKGSGGAPPRARRKGPRRRPWSSPRSAPARAAAAASRSSTRGSSPSTRSTGGARPATGPGSQMRGFDAEQTGEEIWWNQWWEGDERPCPACAGERLRPEALAVTFHGRNISKLTALSVEQARAFLDALALAGREAEIARDIVAELRSRLEFLSRGGAPLPLARPRRAQPERGRGAAHPARLAARLEPARGLLHPRRADDRAARPRQPHAARHAAQAQGQGQHGRRGRARRGDHPRGRARDRPGPRRRRRRRPPRVRRAGEPAAGAADRAQLADGAVPVRPAAAPAARTRAPRRGRAQPAAPRARSCTTSRLSTSPSPSAAWCA